MAGLDAKRQPVPRRGGRAGCDTGTDGLFAIGQEPLHHPVIFAGNARG